MKGVVAAQGPAAAWAPLFCCPVSMEGAFSRTTQAEAAIKAEEAEALAKRIMEAKFDFEDFLKQYKLVSNMGSMQQIMKMLPGMSQVRLWQLAPQPASVAHLPPPPQLLGAGCRAFFGSLPSSNNPADLGEAAGRGRAEL